MKLIMNKRSRSFLIRIILILVSSSIFMSLSFIIQRSLFETNRENMLDIYGEWQGAYYGLSLEQSLFIEQNQLIAQSADMNLMGEVIKDKRKIGGIGYVDEKMIEMGHFTLKDGHWPIMENEIVVESYILDKLHVSYELGQSISLTIQLNNKEIVEAEFVLSGILTSYSANWKADGSLVSVFTKGNIFENEIIKHVFVKCEPGYEDVLNSLMKHQKPCIKNTSAAFPFDITEYGNQSYLMLLILTFILSVTLVFIGYFIFLMKERVNFMTLRALGMSLNQIRYQLFKYSMVIWAISSIVNYLVCTLFLSLLRIIFRLSSTTIILCYEFSDWLIITAILFVISLLGSVFAYTFTGRLILTGNFSNKSHTAKHDRKYKGRYLSPWYLGMIHFRSNRKTNILQILSISFLLLSTFYLTYNYQEDKMRVMNYQDVPDYVLDGRVYSAMYPRQNVIDDTIFVDLKNLNGIDVYYAYYQSDSHNDKISFEWQGYKASPLIKEIPYLVYDTGKVKGNIVVVDVDRSPELFDLLLKDIDEGSIDINEFKKGNSAIMCLPDLMIPKEWTTFKGGSYQFYQGGPIDNQYLLLREDTISINHTVHVESDDFNDVISLTGLIRQHDKKLIYMFYDVYSLIVSPAFMPKLNGTNEINIYLEKDVDVDVVDKQVSILASEYPGVRLENNREKVSLIKAGLQAKLILYSTLFTCILALVTFIQVIISYNKSELVINEIDILKKLGANNRMCKIYYLSGELMNVFISIILANVIFFLMLIIKMNIMNDNLNIKYTFADMISNYSISLHFGLMIMISFLLFIILVNFQKCALYTKRVKS